MQARTHEQEAPKRSRNPKAADLENFSPQSEAAMFYGLFLRGRPAEQIRQEIDIPAKVFRKWMRAREWDDKFREEARRMYAYRKQVLAIFDSLVTSQSAAERWQ